MDVEPESNIRINVGYYNDRHKNLLSIYPTADQIEITVALGSVIPTAEFLTYYLFNKKRPGSIYNSYQSIGQQIDEAILGIRDCIVYNGISIYSNREPCDQKKEVTEHFGDSIGLSTVNQIHGLTEADWNPLPQKRIRRVGRALDFEIQMASTGYDFIQIENKGRCLRKRPTTRSKNPHGRQAKDINDKKKVYRRIESRYQYPYRFLRYGIIASYYKNTNSIVNCLLLDPPALRTADNPLNYKLMTRMRFLSNLLSFIAPEHQLSIALSDRLEKLLHSTDPFELDGIELLDYGKKPFDFSSTVTYPVESVIAWLRDPTYPLIGDYKTSTFWTNMSHIIGGPAGGIVQQISEDNLFFIGVREDLLFMAVNQNFNEILHYETISGSTIKLVKCVFNKQQLEKMRLPTNVKVYISDDRDYYYLYLTGKMHYSKGGLVFGLLPLNNQIAYNDLL